MREGKRKGKTRLSSGGSRRVWRFHLAGGMKVPAQMNSSTPSVRSFAVSAFRATRAKTFSHIPHGVAGEEEEEEDVVDEEGAGGPADGGGLVLVVVVRVEDELDEADGDGELGELRVQVHLQHHNQASARSQKGSQGGADGGAESDEGREGPDEVGHDADHDDGTLAMPSHLFQQVRVHLQAAKGGLDGKIRQDWDVCTWAPGETLDSCPGLALMTDLGPESSSSSSSIASASFIVANQELWTEGKPEPNRPKTGLSDWSRPLTMWNLGEDSMSVASNSII